MGAQQKKVSQKEEKLIKFEAENRKKANKMCHSTTILMLFLDCSSDHWKYEKLLLCYCWAYW